MFAQNRIERLVESLRVQAVIPLRIELWDGRKLDLTSEPRVTVRVPSPSSLRYFFNTNLHRLGEAYVEGRIDVDGSVHDVFSVAESLARHAGRASATWRRFTRHSPSLDREAIRHHYDVSNEFYQLFLDRNMVYSCAYFRREADTLDQAQENKLDYILTKLMLKPGERLLDIGCGWGALIVRAVQKFGARAVGITLSENQFAYVRKRIDDLGLGDRCEVRLQDYRELPEDEPFDKICSVGMFEHVGLKNLPVYFGKMRRLLRSDGLVLNHGITATDPDSARVGLGAGHFINQYVFPHGELPHISRVIREMAVAGMEVADVESLRRHYARTCHEWASRLESNRSEAAAVAGEKRLRIWQIYLAGCAYGFAKGWMNIYQVLACKSGGDAVNPLPMNRDFMYPPSA